MYLFGLKILAFFVITNRIRHSANLNIKHLIISLLNFSVISLFVLNIYLILGKF